MQRSQEMKMVNGRVSASVAETAAAVLRESGLTISAFIRNSLEFIAQRGEVPLSGQPQQAREANVAKLGCILRRLEETPMPGKELYEGLSEHDMVERMKMERYGY